ncbi:MAG TPA: hypothetical protein VL595_25720 [Pseudonocardia sp.]|jgi:hypothetical protein|nr:hypothetical protein [Pseudonocardia sp.]
MPPIPPVDQPLDLTGQTVLTAATSVVALGFALFTLRLCLRRRTWAPALLLASGVLCLVLEPVYDDQFHIWFHDRGQMWGTYSAYGMTQPVWVPITYAWCYGGLALLVWRRLMDGMTRAGLLRMTGMLWAIFTVFELVGINLGVYTYFGDHPLRLFGLPIWVEIPNTVLTVVAAVAFARLEPLLHGIGRASLLAVVPAAFAMLSFGAAFPTLVVISEVGRPTALVYGATIVSLALAVAMLHLAVQAVPADAPAPEPVLDTVEVT